MDVLRGRAEVIYGWPNTHPYWEFKYLSINLVSDIWNCWCDFCRNVIITSCRGTLTRSGKVIAERKSDNSWQKIGYDASQVLRKKSIVPGKMLTFRRHEPTWGDVSSLVQIVNKISISNSPQLLSAFGMSLRGPKHIQTVRNACAYIDIESIDEVNKISIYYLGPRISHPFELIWSLDPSTKSDAIFTWISDLEIICEQVTL